MPSFHRFLGLLVVTACAAAAAPHARNVILFLGDAGGIPTLHAASIHGHNASQALFLQQMPHIGLMDTSAADRWVSDSAAGISAIVTGQKTNVGVLSQAADAVAKKSDGTVVQTILEYAEERGLSTGVITNMSILDATPAGCFAHTNDRGRGGEIFAQLIKPRFGDGVDVVIGGGRKAVLEKTKALGIDPAAALQARGYEWLDSAAAVKAEGGQVAAIVDRGDFDPLPVVANAIKRLDRNPKGYFLMVEWDMHAPNVRRGLEHVLQMDALIRQTASQVGPDTLIVFTADHSFDLRVRGGRRGEPLLPDEEPAKTSAAAPTTVQIQNTYTGEQVAVSKAAADGKNRTRSVTVRVDDGHTGEQVLVAAQGPGAEQVHGFIDNTDVFRIMMAAYGWPVAKPDVDAER